MRQYITVSDIRQYVLAGQKQIVVQEMPILTELAQEEAKRAGVVFVVGATAEQQKQKVNLTDRLPARGTKERQTFREFVKTGSKPILGTFIDTPHPVMTEFVGSLGFDFVAIDSEHSAMHMETVQKMLQGLASTPTYGMVRVPGITYEAISGTMDIGAEAILVPQVRTVEDIQKIRSFSQYPPMGRRGVGPGRATVYGNTIGKLVNNLDSGVGIVIQLETNQAVQNLDAILEESADFVEMFFIGPGDLSMDMGIFAQFNNPVFVDTIMMIRNKTAKAGKKLGIFAGTFDAAVNWLQRGFDMVIVNTELSLLQQVITPGLTKLHQMIGG